MGREKLPWTRMKAVYGAFLFLVFGLSEVYGLGKREISSETAKPLYREWKVFIPGMDFSALTDTQKLTGWAVLRELRSQAETVPFHQRGSEELEAYRSYAQTSARQSAGKALADKRAERDALLFKGYPPWKLKQEIAKMDASIGDLERAVQRASVTVPSIEEKPDIKIIVADKQGQEYPSPPPRGKEYQYCSDQGVDALLFTSMDFFYGHYRLTVGLYSAILDTYPWREELLFSPDDRSAALGDLEDRLLEVLSGKGYARLALHAIPPDSLLSVDGKSVGRGTVDSVPLPPGTHTVEIQADGYVPFSTTLDLQAREKISLTGSLSPLATESLLIDSTESQTAIHAGGLYKGTTPLRLSLPVDSLTYVEGTAGDGKASTAVVAGPSQPDLRVLLKPQSPSADPQPVETERRKFYSAYGRFWIALPVAFFMGGLATTYINAVNYQGNWTLTDSAYRTYYLSIGLYTVAATFLAESLYRLGRYVVVSNDRNPQEIRPTGATRSVERNHSGDSNKEGY